MIFTTKKYLKDSEDLDSLFSSNIFLKTSLSSIYAIENTLKIKRIDSSKMLSKIDLEIFLPFALNSFSYIFFAILNTMESSGLSYRIFFRFF